MDNWTPIALAQITYGCLKISIPLRRTYLNDIKQFQYGANSMTYIGVDGCKRGWFFVRSWGSGLDFGIVETLDELVADTPDNARIMIDIPIGLRDDTAAPRQCDSAARKLLGGKRASSVFPSPIRAILHELTYAEASSKSHRLTGKRISQQSFAIMRKIREVDELVCDSDHARRLIREIHPEVCFWGLNGGVPMSSNKKSAEGFSERLKLIESHLPQAQEIVSRVLSEYLRKDVARDDILDASVALVTAMAPTDSLRTLPESPELDLQGLPMEMVYRCASRQ